MKVTRSSLSLQVAGYLREQIYVHRRYGPGDFIRGQELPSELGVSRGPVRDAIKLLVAEGLLESSPWRGPQVISFSEEEALKGGRISALAGSCPRQGRKERSR